MILRIFMFALPTLLLAACSTVTTGRVRIGDRDLQVVGLTRCGGEARDPVVLSPDAPLTMLVHGCNASAGQFKTLAQVFEAHGQQTVCFAYDDRDSLTTSSTQLLDALEILAENLRARAVTILGHSQGGLVVRRALVDERASGWPALADLRLRLVTISSPFGGIEAASHCGSLVLHILTMGISAAICQAITGNKWMEIHPVARFVVTPGRLTDLVEQHLKVVTNEEGACLRSAPDGACLESDFIFSVDEQYNRFLEHDRRVTNIEVDAGHSAIVGQAGLPPLTLIEVLQVQRILAQTPPEQRQAMARLLARLYQ